MSPNSPDEPSLEELAKTPAPKAARWAETHKRAGTQQAAAPSTSDQLISVKIVALSIPFGDVFRIVAQVFLASVLFGLVLGVIYMVIVGLALNS